jgi:tetratricopeptide (TPR) repeat protein
MKTKLFRNIKFPSLEGVRGGLPLLRRGLGGGVLLLLALACTATLHAQKKTFVRDYTYQASEVDSKVTAQANATTQMRTNLLREVGEFLHTERKSITKRNSQDYTQKIEAITAGIVEMKTLDERWNGFTYYIKAEMTVDPKELERRIAEVLNDKQKTQELEESRKRTLAAEAENARLRKELEETKNEQQRFDLKTKYQQTADALSAEEYFTKGLNVQENGFDELAVEYYQKAIAIDPSHVDAYNNIGAAYADLKDYAEAIRCYQKAITIDPNHAAAHYNMGNAYIDLKNDREAVRCFQKAIVLDPNYASTYYNMGNAYLRLKNNDKAIRCYQKAIDLDLNYAWNNMGNAYTNLKNYREAIRCYQKAITIDPNHAMAYHNMGIAYLGLGNKGKCIKNLRKAARLGYYDAQKILREYGYKW